MSLDCLNTLVGLSQIDCECPNLTANRPVTFNQSVSGLFVDDAEFGVSMQPALLASATCDEAKKPWDLLQRSLTGAIVDFKSDLTAQILNHAKETGKKIGGFSGLVGRSNSYIPAVNNSTDLVRQIRPKYFQSGKINLKGASLGSDSTGTIDIIISSNDGSFQTVTKTVNIEAGKFAYTEFDSPVTLPMSSKTVTDLHYNIRITPGAVKLFNTDIWCCSAPDYLKYFSVAGYGTNSFDESLKATNGLAGHGMILDLDVSCSDLDWLCSMASLSGYDLKFIIARCIQYKAAIRALSEILRTDKVNYFTLLTEKTAPKEILRLKKEYINDVRWIAQNVPDNQKDCWECHENESIFIESISY